MVSAAFYPREGDGGSTFGLAVIRGAEISTLRRSQVDSIEMRGPILALAGPNDVTLVRRDGSSWPNGTSEFRATSAAWALAYEHPRQFTFLLRSLVFVADPIGVTESPKLFRVPLDGTTVAALVPIDVPGVPFPPPAPPQVWAGSPASQPPVVAEDGSAALFPLRSDPGVAIDVYLVREGDVLATNLSRAAEDVLWGERTGNPMRTWVPGHAAIPFTAYGCHDRITPSAAISPDGSWVAYVKGGAIFYDQLPAVIPHGVVTLVSTTSGATQVVNTPARLDSSIGCFGGFVWATKDDLLFWAQPTMNGAVRPRTSELFHFNIPSGTLLNLTSPGGGTPFTSGGTPTGAFRSKDGTRLFIARTGASGGSELLAVNLATFAITKVRGDSGSMTRIVRTETPIAWFLGQGGSFPFDERNPVVPSQVAPSPDFEFFGLRASASRVAYVRNTQAPELWIAEANGTATQVIQGGGFRSLDYWNMQLSKDGSKLVLAVNTPPTPQIVEIDMATHAKRILYQEPGATLHVFGLSY